MNMTDEWNIKEWKKQSRFEEADKACKHACGLGLEKAWEETRGCYVRGGGFMSPESIAEAIAYLYFDYKPLDMED
jgi:hypothetical protein